MFLHIWVCVCERLFLADGRSWAPSVGSRKGSLPEKTAAILFPPLLPYSSQSVPMPTSALSNLSLLKSLLVFSKTEKRKGLQYYLHYTAYFFEEIQLSFVFSPHGHRRTFSKHFSTRFLLNLCGFKIQSISETMMYLQYWNIYFFLSFYHQICAEIVCNLKTYFKRWQHVFIPCKNAVWMINAERLLLKS